LSLLPPGYPSGACKPAALRKDALAKLSCEKNSDPGGPLSSTYTLVRDKAALGGTFDAIVGAFNVVNCPGRRPREQVRPG
jgi:serine/threonine kinase PknH